MLRAHHTVKCNSGLNVTFSLRILTNMLLKLLLKIACVSLWEHLNLLRGQFWGRAALAPVILLRIRALLFTFHAISIFLSAITRESQPFGFADLAIMLNGNEQFATLHPNYASHEGPVTVTLNIGSERKEDHGWIGSSGSK